MLAKGKIWVKIELHDMNWYILLKKAEYIDRPPVLTNPTQDEFLKMMFTYKNVRGVLHDGNLYIAPEEYWVHTQIARDRGFEYDMKGRIWFKRLRNNNIMVTYEPEQVGNIYNVPAFRQLNFNPRSDILSLDGKLVDPPVNYDPSKHNFSNAKDYSDPDTIEEMVTDGELNEGDTATDGSWLYQIINGKPVRIRGVSQKYNWDNGTYGEPLTNWDNKTI